MARARTKRRVAAKGKSGKYYSGNTNGSLQATPKPCASTEKAVPPSSLPTAAVVVPTSVLAPRPNGAKAESKIRTTVLAAIEMQLQGKTRREAAEVLGVTYESLTQYFYLAGKMGWLITQDARDKLQFETVHKIVRNIDQALDSENAEHKQEMTIEAAKGLGLFKKHEVVQNDTAPTMMGLTVTIEQPAGNQPELTVGSIGGTPGYVDAE